jgi:N-acylneuraminate cytidylyltransferase/CMP-N,N'-diacetyllegionaminic acid synthase|tara:strand:+ start:553 stop:1257 length:705 start_codon:yes stop_codon:yes gene_type:complete
MNLLTIIPARGSSKGIKNKNIKKLCGYPLIAWTILTARKSKYIKQIIVSTDSKKIANISKKYGATIPFIRPKKYATDKASSFSVLKHAINFFNSKNINFDYVLFLEPTSPLRQVEDIDNCIKKILAKKIDTMVSVTEVICQHPRFIYSINKKNILEPYITNKNNLYVRRQDIEPLYYLEGSIYLSRIRTLMEKKTFYHNRTVAYKIKKWKSLEIDDIDDFNLAKYYIKEKKILL